jgi:hypothetical protein
MLHAPRNSSLGFTVVSEKFPWISLDDDVLNFSNFWEVEVKEVWSKQVVMGNYYASPGPGVDSTNSNAGKDTAIKSVSLKTSDIPKPSPLNTQTKVVENDKSSTSATTSTLSTEPLTTSATNGDATAKAVTPVPANNDNNNNKTAAAAVAAANKTRVLVKLYQYLKPKYLRLLEILLQHKQRVQQRQQQIATLFQKRQP